MAYIGSIPNQTGFLTVSAKANSACVVSSAAFDQANTANTTAIAAFGQANTANITAVAAFLQANTAYSSAVLKTGNTMTGNLVMSDANIAFTTATNSGIYWTNTGSSFIHSPAANTLVFGTAFVEDMRIDPSGNVGIGTNPTAKLDVNGTIRANVVNEVFSNVAMSGNTATLNLLSSSVFQINLSNNIGIFTWSNPPAGNTAYGFTLKIVQNTSARSITWPTSVDWAGATAPTLSSGSGNVDVFVFFTHDAGSTWYGFTSGKDLR